MKSAYLSLKKVWILVLYFGSSLHVIHKILTNKNSHCYFILSGAAVYSSELLLNGIVTQKLEYERSVALFQGRINFVMSKWNWIFWSVGGPLVCWLVHACRDACGRFFLQVNCSLFLLVGLLCVGLSMCVGMHVDDFLTS